MWQKREVYNSPTLLNQPRILVRKFRDKVVKKKVPNH